VGLAVLAPTLREELTLSLGEIGILLSAAWLGATVTLLPWGLAADRYGERTVLVLGLLGSSLCLVGAAHAGSFEILFVLLVLSGASGASVNSASGRAVMHWFAADQRGLALGIRQTAIPLGGLVVALVVPGLARAGGSEAAFLFLAGFSAFGALVGGLVLRGREDGSAIDAGAVSQTLRDRRLWRLSVSSALYLYAQVAVIGFGVLFLHDEHGLSDSDAALAIAASQVLAVALRVGLGRWSDVLGSRVMPLRRAGLAVAFSLVLVALLADGSLWLLVPALVLAGGLSMSWNGLSFTAAAELAGTARSGAAIGFQQSVLSGLGVLAPVLFAATVSNASWQLAFGVAALLPLVGWAALRPLRAY
jgi:sugar phosphate permease